MRSQQRTGEQSEKAFTNAELGSRPQAGYPPKWKQDCTRQKGAPKGQCDRWYRGSQPDKNGGCAHGSDADSEHDLGRRTLDAGLITRL